MSPTERDRVAMASLMMKLRGQGKAGPGVLAALERVPRHVFVPAPYRQDAFADRAVPIECGQMLQAPSTVASVLGALGLEPGQKVLEIGCGSGYQAAVMATYGCHVVTLDRYRTLIELASDRFASLKLSVEAIHADGFEGFSRRAPFDRIVIDGAVERVPPAVMDQLGDRGVLVAPVGKGPTQTLVRISRDGRLFNRLEKGQVRYVALVEGMASRL